MNMRTNEMIILAGPTGCGKSALAMQLHDELRARNIGTEIISADSVAVYRNFVVGTAKADSAERARVPHHLLDIQDPEKNFTAGDFVRAADPIIARLHKAGEFPLIVGGTGFYLRALLSGMAHEDSEDRELRDQINEELMGQIAEQGLETLYSEMIKLDPSLKESIHLNDEYRIVRALEVMRATGKKWSELNQAAKLRKPRFEHVRYFCLNVEREVLRERIRARTQKMLNQGLLEEVQKNISSGIPLTAKPFLSVGYRECLEYLDKIPTRGNSPRPTSKHELAEKIVRETMHLAKNQITWLRGQAENAVWLNQNSVQEVLEHLAPSDGL